MFQKFSILLCVLCFHLVCIAVSILTASLQAASTKVPLDSDILFQIGKPDATSWEFQAYFDWLKSRNKDGVVFRYVCGKHKPRDWPRNHPSTRDYRAAGHIFTTEIQFESARDYSEEELYFIMGFCFVSHHEPSLIRVKVNGVAAEPVRQPKTPNDYGYKPDTQVGIFESLTIPIPPGAVKKGTNVLSITLEDGSFYLYDYLTLREKPIVPEQLPIVTPDLLTEFRNGPMKNVQEVVFALRQPGPDPHWYSNFGYYIDDVNDFPFPLGGGGGLYALNIETKNLRTIFEDLKGNVRDPQVHYDAEKILFSYLPVGKRHYNLYEIQVDGTGLRQLTFGDWDDIEATYTASGNIIFSSTRSKRWVQCAASPVATLHRCGPNGENIMPISSNNDQDNTPWPLHNGQIIYMRWDYIDRSQMDYHHLWTMNPDGTKQMVYYGNLHPGMVMLAPKPIPGSEKIVACFSPGHGLREHYGSIVVVDPKNGPDDLDRANYITNRHTHCDPWAFSETAFMAASHDELHLIDEEGTTQTIYKLPENLRSQNFWISEPRPLTPRQRETLIADQIDLEQATGRLVLADIYRGRRMKDLPRGTVKDLLVLEPLPAPVHYNGGMEMTSSGGTFMLERIVGTVPVTPEGMADMELPAMRNYTFVARDANGDSIKRMHSFTTVMPGETNVCLGCHESRTEAPGNIPDSKVLRNLAAKADAPKPVPDVPDLFDYNHDIQPILDKHCVSCHNNDRTDGGVNLVGDWAPLYTISYLNLSLRRTFGDNRNRAKSDFQPYEIGTQKSKLFQLIKEKHEGVELSPQEIERIRYWLESGANFAGTYAANFRGAVGYHYNFGYNTYDEQWPETVNMGEAIRRRCAECHTKEKRNDLPERLSALGTAKSPIIIVNMTHPEKSKLLRAPLSQEAGGTQRCGKAVFDTTQDPDYQTILVGILRAEKYIQEESNRYTAKNFVPHHSYVREMIRFGALPEDHDYSAPVDVFEIDRIYWKNLYDYSPLKQIAP